MQLPPLVSVESPNLENNEENLYAINMLVLLFFSSAFYDCSANSFDKQFVICSLDYCVLTMDYW